MGNVVMDEKNAVYGALAECFITIGTRRYNFMSMTDFESTWETTIKDVGYLPENGGNAAIRDPGKQ